MFTSILLTIAPAFGFAHQATHEFSKFESFPKAASHFTFDERFGHFHADTAKQFDASKFENHSHFECAFSFQKDASKFAFSTSAKGHFAGKASMHSEFKAFA